MDAAHAQGMVAVVRGMKDAGLAVTLLENGRQYTLAPNTHTTAMKSGSNPTSMPLYMPGNINGNMSGYMPSNMPVSMPMMPQHLPSHGLGINQGMQSGSLLRSVATNAELNDRICSGTQAVDGRYASVYQTTVCKMKPTSPPVELTEFPPQRPARLPGHDNFVVGGTGSGDTSYNPVRIPNSFRGGMVWANRGSVFTPRPSKQPDAFENSLRKYPRISPDRSSEIVERLITYSQAKNYGRIPRCSNSNSQTRNFECEGEVYNARSPTRIAKGCDTSFRNSESPTRERTTKLDREYLENRRLYNRVYDVRHLRDVSRAVKDTAKSIVHSNNPYQSSFRERRERERSDSPEFRKIIPDVNVPSMVNSEIQAAATMVCREVSTTPGQSKRNVAATAEVEHASEGAVFPIQRSVQTVNSLHTVRKSVQTTLSSIDIPSTRFAPTIRRTKSEENIRSKRDMQLEILEKLDKIFVVQETKGTFTNAQSKPIEKDSSNTAKIVPIWYKDCDKRCQGVKKRLMNDITFETGFNVYRAEVIPLATMTEREREIITAWLHDIPLKRKDFLGRVIKKEQILSYVVCRISMIPNTVQIDKRRFRAEVLDIVDDMPIDVAIMNKYIYENKLVEDLISKLESERIRSLYGDKRFRWNHNKTVYTASTGSGYRKVNEPLETKLRVFVKKQLEDSIQTSQLDLDIIKAANVETDLVDILTDYLDDIKDGKEIEAKDEIATLLQDTRQILNNQATNFASLLMMEFKKILEVCDEQLPVQNKAIYNLSTAKNNCKTENCINTLVDPLNKTCQELDLKAIEESYVQNLEKEITKWLSSNIKAKFAEENPTIFQAIVKDLAKDIVDRHKYSELNPSRRVSEKDEIEHLKYQIFKWVYIFEGEDNIVNLEKASDLMKIIKTVPKPVLITPKSDSEKTHQITDKFRDSTGEKSPLVFNQRAPIRCEDFSVWPNFQTTWGPHLFSVMPVQEGNLNNMPDVVQQINDEFDEFLKQWVQTIPIEADAELAEKIRLGLLHGVWKAIAKVKTLPGVLTNPFYYQDALDDEIEQLFSLLPQTQELASKKHLAKVQLIEKVTQVNERIKAIYVPQTFEQQLAKGMTVYIPRTDTTTRGEDSAQLFEDLQILNLADEYIMFIRYREDDPIKANVYKTKLLKRAQEFVEQLKRQHNKELKDIDTDMYMNDILAAIQQVPLPSEETIEKEADIVMLGMEIDRWFADLPLHPITDRYEMLKRRRLRNALANRIYDLEKSLNFADSSADKKLKHEVSLVLERLPLGKDESLRINMMVDQLANRIRNRQRSKIIESSCKGTCKGNCKNIPTNARQSIAGAANFSQQTEPQNQQQLAVPPSAIRPTPKAQMIGSDGRLWYTFDDQRQSTGPMTGIIPPSAINPPPTDMMQDATGRFWYAFDRPLYQNQGQGPQYQEGPQAFAGPAPQQVSKAQDQADGTFWLSQKLKDYEQAHPPVATPNTSVEFGPPKSKVIQDPSMFGAYQQMPASSSFAEPNVQQGYGGPQQSPGGLQQSYGGPQQSPGGPQQSYGGPQQSPGGPQQSLGAPQQSYGGPQQSPSAPQQSYSAGAPMYQNQGQSPQYQQGVPQATAGPIPQAPQQVPNAQADDTFWLSQKLKDYEQAHPPVATPNTSVQFGPPKSKVIQDPTMFGAYPQMPASSSFADPNVQQYYGGPQQSPGGLQQSYGGPQQGYGAPQQSGAGSYAQQSYAAQQRTVGLQANNHGPWPVIIDSHHSTQTGGSLVRCGNTEPSKFISINETNAPAGIWSNQPSAGQRSIAGQPAVVGSGAGVSAQQYSVPQGGVSAGQQSIEPQSVGQGSAYGPQAAGTMGQSQFASMNETQAPAGIWNSPPQAVSGQTGQSYGVSPGQGTVPTSGTATTSIPRPSISKAGQLSMSNQGSAGPGQGQFVSLDQTQAPAGMWTSQPQAVSGQTGQSPGVAQSYSNSPGGNMSAGQGIVPTSGTATGEMTRPSTPGVARVSMASQGSAGPGQSQFVSLDQTQAPAGIWTSQPQAVSGQISQGPGVGQTYSISPGGNMSTGQGNVPASGMTQANMTGQGSAGPGQSQFVSLDQTQAPAGMWTSQPQGQSTGGSGPRPIAAGPAGASSGRRSSAAGGFCSKICKKGAASAGCPSVSVIAPPAADMSLDPIALQGANETRGPMWLSKFLRDYEQAHPNTTQTIPEMSFSVPPYGAFGQSGVPESSRIDASSSTPKSCLCKAQDPTRPCCCRLAVLDMSQQNTTQQDAQRRNVLQSMPLNNTQMPSMQGQAGQANISGARVSSGMQTACTNMPQDTRRPTLLGAGTYILPNERPCNGTRVIEVGVGPPGSKKPRGNQQKRNEEATDDESDGRCRCYQKLKRRKGRGMCHNFNLLDFACPYRYFPPPPCYY